MRTVVVVQARMMSTRLPGKVLKPVLGTPLLEYVISRVRRARAAADVVVATTVNEADEPIVRLCERLGTPAFRGSEDDVLDRYLGAAKAAGADPVVRVTADCPLIDPEIVDRVIRAFTEPGGRYDYVSNTITRSYPRGMDTEVFSFRALQEAAREATASADREHVTRFIYTRPSRYRLKNVACTEDLSRHRWTVDTPEDFELIRRILEAVRPANPRFGLGDLLALIAEHPEWTEINARVEQKSPDAGGSGVART